MKSVLLFVALPLLTTWPGLAARKQDHCATIVAKACEGYPKKITSDPTGSFNGSSPNDLKKLHRESAQELQRSAVEIGRALYAGRATAQQVKEIEAELTDDLFDGGVPLTFSLSGDERRKITESPAYIDARKTAFRKYSETLLPKRETEELGKNLWPKIQTSMSNTVRKLGGSPRVQAYLQSRIKSTPWGGTSCYANENIPEMLAVNAFYDAKKGVVICPGWLRANSSKFSSTMVIAHELAHSIDLCTLSTELESDPDLLAAVKRTLEPIQKCLSGKNSAGAKPDAKNCGQQKEAFADFLSTEVMADILENDGLGALNAEGKRDGLINTWRSACKTGDHDHPATMNRLDKILLAHPKIRQQLDCAPSRTQYCGGGGSLRGGAEADPAHR